MPYFDPNQFAGIQPFASYNMNLGLGLGPTAFDEEQLYRSALESEFSLDRMPESYIKQVCAVVEKRKDPTLMASFLQRIQMTSHRECAAVLKLKCVQLFELEQFRELYALIESRNFPREYHKDLQDIWNDAHYKETERTRNRHLDPVTRYRVRKKHGFPTTIWDGEQTSYCFKKCDRKILREAYLRNNMPTQAEKAELARRTQLSVTQVSNWFKNQRQRARQHQKEKRQQYNDLSDDSDSGRSGTSGSRGSHPISEEDENRLNASSVNSAIHQPSTSLASHTADFQPPVYANYPNRFESWPGATPFSAAQMYCNPLSIAAASYPYTNPVYYNNYYNPAGYTTSPPMAQMSQYLKAMHYNAQPITGDSLAEAPPLVAAAPDPTDPQRTIVATGMDVYSQVKYEAL